MKKTVYLNKKLTKNSAITLVALVITIVVLLILARSSSCKSNRGEWNTRKSNRSKTKNRRSRKK